ncbi:stage II sporulation protein P [uncultured Clostridium sp.]|uniref:Stage II sporulation protein P n=1 Tax=Muricoprocola aceti TaxID=2981772 RepID=A0ABT2SIN6_9FIRM|nr:stage II sporulation protein P [Muricoprocola aceti]MCI7226032.1 stage II sporulation protein P [Lachnospiraceae bacterium]MCQ4772500.1 stage II sporulation protein P [Lacrimispora saccharolytica]RGD66013.1 stage II sporulation protein P [Lachnospiraceae bacterium OF09-6]SCH00286.1 stage II sporulation protein P [uncultured Clostridium sp.]MCU6724130.1 stage II sporulation protein P [Muricoprocola aceti]
MRLLDRLIRGVLTISVILLGGYILVRTVTIAGENGMFQDSPVLSALYRKLETAGMQIYIPVISYQEDVLEASPEQDLADSIGRSLYPAGFWAEREQKQEGREEEYELILAAEARAEEEKKPLDLKQWMEERTEGDQEAEFETLLNRYFSMDAATTIDSSRLNNSLLDLDLTLDTEKEGPQILIYHSHSQEGFVDTVEGDDTTTIVGVGDYLAKLLTETYGYQVIHDRGVYDLVDGVLDRNVAYDYSGAAVEQWLSQYPQIQVIIDLHRDGVDGKKFVVQENGRPTANLMFILGMSRTADQQDISYLPNPYIKENMAFALQIQERAEIAAPGLMRNIYLMAYRFNLHYRPRSMLLEAGTQLNTLEEEKNAMEVFAGILDAELKGR